MKEYRILDLTHYGRLTGSGSEYLIQEKGVFFGWNNVAECWDERGALDLIKQYGGFCSGIHETNRD